MKRTLRTMIGAIYWPARDRVLRSGDAAFVRRLANPLWVARACLTTEVRRHADLARGRMLDVGCGGQPYRRLFTGVDRYIAADLPPTRGVDVHADALRLPFADGSFDAVLCNQVLEHVPAPATLFAEVTRVLRPGGVLLLTTPQVWGLHHEPYDFYRYTRYGLTHLAAAHGLTIESVAPTCGLWATIGQRIADTVVHHYAGRAPAIVRLLLGLALSPMLAAAFVLDKAVGRHGDTLDNVLVARKPSCRKPQQETHHARAA